MRDFEYYPDPKHADYCRSRVTDNYQIVEFPDCKHIMEFQKKFETEHVESRNWIWGEYRALETTDKHLEAGIPSEDHYKTYLEKKKLVSEFDVQEARTSAVKQVRRRKFSEDGDELDIDRYMSGDINIWQSKPPVRKKIVARFFLNVGILSHTNSKVITENVAIFANLLELAEAQGISTEILVGAASFETCKDEDTDIFITYFTEKRPHEYFDTGKLLSRGAPGLFRHYIFEVRRIMANGGCRTWTVGRSPVDNTDLVKLQPAMNSMGVDIFMAVGSKENDIHSYVQKIQNIQYNEQVF